MLFRVIVTNDVEEYFNQSLASEENQIHFVVNGKDMSEAQEKAQVRLEQLTPYHGDYELVAVLDYLGGGIEMVLTPEGKRIWEAFIAVPDGEEEEYDE